jgi:hypothetical protein
MFMEELSSRNSNNDFKEKIRRIKEYVLSLINKKYKRQRKNVEDDIINQIEEVFDDEYFPNKSEEESSSGEESHE